MNRLPSNRLPSREELLAFIRERSGKVGTREIARAFGAKNADRAALNRMLRELADEGFIDRRRKRLHHPGTLPPVVLADITGRDSDGELLARPTEWDEEAHGAAPVIHIATPRRARPGEVAGVGDRALIRIDETRDEETSGRVIKLIDRAKHRTLGIFRGLPGGGGRLVPIDKKQLGRELGIAADATAGAVDGDLVAVEVARHGRLGLAAGTVVERLGSLKSERAVSLIAIHAHDIPHVFPRAVLAEADAARAASAAGREDWRNVPFVTIDPPDAKDHDDAVHARARSAIRKIPAAISSASPSPTWRIMCGPARRSTARRSNAATRSIFPTASCRCCRSAFPTICARCARTKTGRRLPCA